MTATSSRAIPGLAPDDRRLGRAVVTECTVHGGYAQVRLTLSDGRHIFFSRRKSDLRDATGRNLTIGAEVELFGDYLLPKAVVFGGRVMFRADHWWHGPPPPG